MRHGAHPPKRPRSKLRVSGSLRSLIRRDGGVCWLCGTHATEAEATRDHVRPHALGGYDKKKNYRLAHADCNEARRHMPEAEVLRVLAELRESLAPYTPSRPAVIDALLLATAEWDRLHRDELDRARLLFPQDRRGRGRRHRNREAMKRGRQIARQNREKTC